MENSEALIKEKEEAMLAFSHKSISTSEIIEKLESLSPELCNDKELAEFLIILHPSIYPEIPESFKKSSVFAVEFINQHIYGKPASSIFLHLHADLFKNKDFVLYLTSNYPIEDIYPFIDNNLLDKDFNKLLLATNCETYSELSKKDREDSEYLDLVIDKYPQALFFASEDLQNNYHYQSLAFNNPKHKNAPYGYVNNEYEDWLELVVPEFLIKKEELWLKENMPENPIKHKAKRF